MVRDLVRQARDRDPDHRGTCTGAVLTHLVMAALDLAAPRDSQEPGTSPPPHAPAVRSAPIVLGDTLFHVVPSPDAAAIGACRDSLDRGFRPVLITLPGRVAVAAAVAEETGLTERFDVFDIEQFLGIHLHLRTGFRAARRPAELRRFASRYNEIVDRAGADPSLKMRFRKALPGR